MASTNPESKSPRAAWVLGALAVLALGFGIRSQLGHSTQRAPFASNDDATPSPRKHAGAAHGASPTPATAGPTAPARVLALQLPRNMDADAYLNQRFANQAAPEIVPLKVMTPEEKDQKLREMFPDYDQMQAEVEAERARLGLKN